MLGEVAKILIFFLYNIGKEIWIINHNSFPFGVTDAKTGLVKRKKKKRKNNKFEMDRFKEIWKLKSNNKPKHS